MISGGVDCLRKFARVVGQSAVGYCLFVRRLSSFCQEFCSRYNDAYLSISASNPCRLVVEDDGGKPNLPVPCFPSELESIDLESPPL